MDWEEKVHYALSYLSYDLKVNYLNDDGVAILRDALVNLQDDNNNAAYLSREGNVMVTISNYIDDEGLSSEEIKNLKGVIDNLFQNEMFMESDVIKRLKVEYPYKEQEQQSSEKLSIHGSSIFDSSGDDYTPLNSPVNTPRLLWDLPTEFQQNSLSNRNSASAPNLTIFKTPNKNPNPISSNKVGQRDNQQEDSGRGE